MLRVKTWSAHFSFGAERKSASLCQLHDGLAFFCARDWRCARAQVCVRRARRCECVASRLQLGRVRRWATRQVADEVTGVEWRPRGR